MSWDATDLILVIRFGYVFFAVPWPLPWETFYIVAFGIFILSGFGGL